MDPVRLATDLFNAMSDMSGFAAYGAIIGVLLICGLGVPIPEDITLLAAGLLASSGHITLGGALIAGFTGVMIGDSFLFFMGRKFGAKIFGLPGFRRIFTPERIRRAEDRVRRNGHFICFIARFLPGLRSPIFALAGAMGVKPSVFLMQDGFAALISVPVWVYVGFWLGENWEEQFARVEKLQDIFLAVIGIVVLGYFVFRFFRKRKASPVPKS
ncbi:MAG: DedA family protein [Bdellovibrionaceae bacterium]|nr:DedA family protein [Pseudobdellovibrionaceae bacterium]